jgi:dolichol-phosphate mannosyltransferase
VTPTAAEPRILVSLATYNERDNLAPLVGAVRETVPAADVLVIDDNSPDGTGRVADELAAADPHLRVLHRPGKLGLGTAILAAMGQALDRGYDLLLNMDADFSHHPRYLPALLAGMSRHDVMIGSRYVKGGGTVNWPLPRRLMSRGVNTVVRLLMRLPAEDTSGAFRCYRVALLRRADLTRLRSRGYSFQQEVLYRCRRAGARIGETPIIFENRRAGASKVNPAEAARSMAVLLRVGLAALFGFDREAPRPRPRGRGEIVGPPASPLTIASLSFHNATP